MKFFSHYKLVIILSIIFLLKIDIKAAKNEITFWEFWSEKWIQPAIDRFEAENPPWKIKIERLTWSGGKNKLITALAAGYGPDVMEIGSTWAAEFITSGALVELENISEDLDLFALNTGEYEGRSYAVPWTISVGGLYYNKTLLKQAGFDSPPTTWAELLEQSEKINNPNKKIYGFGVKMGAETTWQKFLPFAWSNGADVLDENENIMPRADLFIESLTFYDKLARAGLIDSNLTIRKAFLNGKLAFVIEDPGQYAYFKKNAPDLDFGVVGLPNAPATGSHKAFGGAELLAVNVFSKNKQIAQKFISFMVELENTKLITSKIPTLFPSVKSGIKDKFYIEDNPHLQVFLDELNYTRSTIVHQHWLEMQRSLVLNVEKVLYQKLTPKEAVDDLTKQIGVIINQ